MSCLSYRPVIVVFDAVACLYFVCVPGCFVRRVELTQRLACACKTRVDATRWNEMLVDVAWCSVAGYGVLGVCMCMPGIYFVMR